MSLIINDTIIKLKNINTIVTSFNSCLDKKEVITFNIEINWNDNSKKNYYIYDVLKNKYKNGKEFIAKALASSDSHEVFNLNKYLLE